jgi:hypothetical protein
MSNEVSFARNIGLTVWNYSKLIAHAMSVPRMVRKYHDQYTSEGRWPAPDLAELERLTGLLESGAVRAEATWNKIKEAVADGNSDLIDDRGPVAVIGGGGDRPQLRERLRAIFSSDKSAYESFELVDQARRLMVEVTTRLGDDVVDPARWPYAVDPQSSPTGDAA